MRKAGSLMLRYSICLLVVLHPFLAASQKPPISQRTEQAFQLQIDDDADYSPHLERVAYQKNGPVVVLDEGHGNPQFDKAFAKLVAADGYQVRISNGELTFDELSKARVLVIMNPGLFMSWKWLQDPHPIFSDRESAAIRDWVAAGGSLFFASNAAKRESGEVLLSRLGVEFSDDHVSDPKLNAPLPPEKAFLGTKDFTREKNMLSNHIIMSGRLETERVDAVALASSKAIRKAPDNAVTLIRHSDQALVLPRDVFLDKQMMEQARELQARGGKETQPGSSPLTSAAPAPGIPVAVAFSLGKGRVVVLGNSSAISSVMRKGVFMGNPISRKTGLGDADNEKFTINVMHWLTGLLD